MKRALIAVPIVVIISGLVGWAVSYGSAAVAGAPVPLWAIGLVFAINWVAFVPAYLLQTERFFDLTGSLSYLAAAGLALALSPNPDLRAWLTFVFVYVWAIRLGAFLFSRVHADGGDGRFDEIKPDPWRFFVVWTIQSMWVTLTLAAALVSLTAAERVPVGWLTWLGVAIWVFGFGYEVVADAQKRAFRANPANQGRWIEVGLWRWSRHPNYFGEITLWVGILVIAMPVLTGWNWVAVISPIFVTLLLTRVSGVPMLTERAKKRWGDDPDFQAYLRRTPMLIPGKRRDRGTKPAEQ